MNANEEDPLMIQSMEILQLPITALQELIQQELQEKQRAEQALRELQQSRDEIERLKAQLRALGQEPSA